MDDIRLFVGIGCLVLGILMIYVACHRDYW